MESSNCVYNVSSVDSTLEALESNSTLAIVELVITCPNVCYIVFGNGNPDLAGIGLFVSYCIQLGLVGISTLLYLAMYYKKTSTSQDVHSRRRNRISKAQSVLAETTAYLTTTVVISCVALAYQTHTAYEHMLITTLAPLQIYLYILHVFTRVAPLHSEAEYAEYDREATFHLVYLFVDIALLIAIRDIPHMNTLCKIILTCDPSQLAQRTPYKVPITTTETHVAIALTFTLWLLLRKRIREGWAAAASSPSTSTLIGDETDRIRRRRILNKIVGAIHQSEKVTIELLRIASRDSLLKS
ncbi:hypothetical protein EV426DRAFT_375601 [Tirmania nivea]|nr:hypothetical protein EV426DRAFT_375601 [Tirmania nivea]